MPTNSLGCCALALQQQQQQIKKCDLRLRLSLYGASQAKAAIEARSMLAAKRHGAAPWQLEQHRSSCLGHRRTHLTPASPTMPMAIPAPRPDRPQARPAPRCAYPSNK